jgi:hypothetical protein
LLAGWVLHLFYPERPTINYLENKIKSKKINISYAFLPDGTAGVPLRQ